MASPAITGLWYTRDGTLACKVMSTTITGVAVTMARSESGGTVSDGIVHATWLGGANTAEHPMAVALAHQRPTRAVGAPCPARRPGGAGPDRGEGVGQGTHRPLRRRRRHALRARGRRGALAAVLVVVALTLAFLQAEFDADEEPVDEPGEEEPEPAPGQDQPDEDEPPAEDPPADEPQSDSPTDDEA